MRIHSKLFVAVAVAIGAAPFVVAQAPVARPKSAIVVPVDQRPTNEQLTRLFEVMRIREQIASTSKMMPQLMQQQFSEQLENMEKEHPELSSMKEEQRQAASGIMQKYMTRATGVYTTNEMLADMKAIYQRHLSRSDVDGIIAFYSSPAGQHMLDMVPVIMQEYMPAAMEKMQVKMRPLIEDMQKELTELVESSGPGANKPDQK
jgi:hypothetical protein